MAFALKVSAPAFVFTPFLNTERPHMPGFFQRPWTNPTLKRGARTLVWVCAWAWLGVAHAQEWAPNKPVRIIVPIVGSTNDVLARLLAPKLSEALGQAVLVENKPGAGGNLGADLVAKAAPDGHTLLIGYNGPMAINVSLFDKMPYDPVKDLAPITLAVKSPQ